MTVITLMALCSCAMKMVPVDGHQVNACFWKRIEPNLNAIAAADLDCDEVDLQVVVVGPYNPGGPGFSKVPNRVKAVGCDEQITYQRVPKSETYLADIARR